MKTLAKILMAALPWAVAAGCATGPKLDMNKVAQAFYGQERTYKAVLLSGATEIAIRGTNMTLALEAPHTPLAMLPQDPNSMLMLTDAVKNTILGGLGIYTLGKVATQGPTIVQQPAPLVVQPEVVQVPAAAAAATAEALP